MKILYLVFLILCAVAISPGDGIFGLRRRRSCHTVNCVWNNWQAWTACSVTCGSNGKQSRIRDIKVHATCGGFHCNGKSSEIKSCSSGPPRQNCKWNNWTEWLSCSITCGSGGTQTRVRSVATPAICGGLNCNGLTLEEKSCSGSKIIDCTFGDWTKWGHCSVTCGDGGTQRRTRIVETPAYCGGTECIGLTMEERLCSGKIISDCTWLDWMDWTPCSKTCGNGGTKTRSRVVATPQYCGGFACMGVANEAKECLIDEVVNCVWDEWTNWTPCSITCGSGGIEKRNRVVARPAYCGGFACIGVANEAKACFVEEVVNCVWAEWTNWTPCSITCGSGGIEKRFRVVARSAYCGGLECKGKEEEEERLCYGEKVVNCKWEDWTHWTLCTESSGKQRRTRYVVNRESCGGIECNGSHEEEQSCSQSDAVTSNIMFYSVIALVSTIYLCRMIRVPKPHRIRQR